MNFKHLFSTSLFILILFCNPLYSGAAPIPGFDPNMSEEELLNQLMEEINSALPEDQRDTFWQEVAKETERLEEATANMSDEEKEKYLMDLITAEPGKAEELEPEIPEEKPIEKKEEIKPAPRSAKETKEISEILQSIVRSIEKFLDKAAAFPNFDGKVERWAKQRRLNDWQEGQKWATFKDALNKFITLLSRFKEKDPKIGMKHIDALLKNEPLIQSLKQLEAKLTREVPLIEVNAFAIASMSKQTKNAIAHVINALTEALYRLNLPDELQKIIAEFDVTAKQLREQEEKAAKSALTQSKAFQPSRPTRVAGKAERKNGLSLPSLDDLGIPGYSPRSGSASGTSGESETAPGAKKSPSGKMSGGDKTGAAKKDDKKDGKKGTDDKKGKDIGPDKNAKDTGAIKSPDIKKHIDSFEKDLKEASDTMLSTDELSSKEKLESFVASTAPAA
ncbi:MAG: hypothetical protein WD055_00285 [Candidatus Dependentiae bacterium]